MTAPLDPSLLAWVRSFADAIAEPPAAPKPPKPAEVGAARTRAWLRSYLADGRWHAGDVVRKASRAEGILNQWLHFAVLEICEKENRGRRGSWWRLRPAAKKGDGA